MLVQVNKDLSRGKYTGNSRLIGTEWFIRITRIKNKRLVTTIGTLSKKYT